MGNLFLYGQSAAECSGHDSGTTNGQNMYSYDCSAAEEDCNGVHVPALDLV